VNELPFDIVQSCNTLARDFQTTDNKMRKKSATTRIKGLNEIQGHLHRDRINKLPSWRVK
jgi:hypothetical protein